ncbi:Cof-type HAD-IIB family hydrolase [Collinsella sp. AGMB00827]|uniref:Cof-type HAD-IIB family hydrolase n=1 Tax=Collinsella ureilytica TaxID=2869515 RepID=A0ABS7MHR0_9ACTN|nr:Cof-type HAD-IIB family hydrolase [Collinsella urealyticum]MBY4796893.1 Cof-type HAD-IIB family hydrolase [Collinsella urealyticum]
MIKAVFFDVDGTLASFKTHSVPPSAQAALDELRRQGILTIIATGRSHGLLAPELAQGFDAYITLNGQLCFDGEGVFRDCPIDPKDAKTVVSQAASGAYDLLVLHEDSCFINRRGERVADIEKTVGITYELGDLSLALERPIYQFCAFVTREEEAQIREACEHVALTRWIDGFCDVVPAAGGKGYGVRATLERFGIDASEAVAFGDGENDLPMFQEVGTAVAMGDAWEQVQAQADFVTASVDEDGIWKACEHLGLV